MRCIVVVPFVALTALRPRVAWWWSTRTCPSLQLRVGFVHLGSVRWVERCICTVWVTIGIREGQTSEFTFSHVEAKLITSLTHAVSSWPSSPCWRLVIGSGVANVRCLATANVSNVYWLIQRPPTTISPTSLRNSTLLVYDNYYVW